MEQQKDIGKLIEYRLKDTAEAPAGLEWDRVSDSLDKRDRKKRILLFIWTGVAVSGLAIIASLFYGGYTSSEKEPIVNNKMIHSSNQIETKKASTAVQLNETEANIEVTNNNIPTPVLDSEQAAQSNPITELKPEQEQIKKKEPSSNEKHVIPVQNGEWATNKAQEDITKTFTVDSITTYRYYNHDTENELITTDKKSIDSLVELTERTTDSIN